MIEFEVKLFLMSYNVQILGCVCVCERDRMSKFLGLSLNT